MDCSPNQIDHQDQLWFRRPIHIAASRGHLNIVKMLLDSGVDVDSMDRDQRTALHWASTYGKNDVVEYMLSCGASVNHAQSDGFTPLHSACCLGHDQVCETLIENGADVNAYEKDGWTPLHTAVCYCRETSVLLLLEHGASVTGVTGEDEHILHIAASSGSERIMDHLLNACSNSVIDINLKNNYGYTPFHLAVYHGKLKVAIYLLMVGADMNTMTAVGETPFYLALIRGQESVIKVMVSYGYNLSHDWWMKDNILPAGKASKWSHFTEMACNPRPLKDSCFALVRRLLGLHLCDDNLELPIPRSLQAHIVEDVMNLLP